MVGKNVQKLEIDLYCMKYNRSNMVVEVIDNSWQLPGERCCGFISTKKKMLEKVTKLIPYLTDENKIITYLSDFSQLPEICLYF